MRPVDAWGKNRCNPQLQPMNIKEPFDIVIHGATIITADDDLHIIEDGLICIKADRLVRIESCLSPAAIPPAVKTIDAHGMLALPGLVNTHTHMPMTLFRGLADDLPLQQWLEKHIFPAESRHIYPESVEIGSLLACAEMILSGTTTCCDGYFFEDEAADSMALPSSAARSRSGGYRHAGSRRAESSR